MFPIAQKERLSTKGSKLHWSMFNRDDKNSSSYYGFNMNMSIDGVLSLSMSSNLMNFGVYYTIHSL